MLLSYYCFEINTHGIKKSSVSNANYWLNRGGPAFAQDAFYEDLTPKIFALADGRTERVFHKKNKL